MKILEPKSIDVNHFSQVAENYQDLRTTDQQPISYILNQLNHKENLKLIDLGCGTGRYDNLLLDILGESSTLTGVDDNQEMLKQFIGNMKKNNHHNFKIINCQIENLDNRDLELYDVALSFNALHHFNIGKTLLVINNILKKNGMAFLYSRTTTQNERSIWGQNFPKFNMYESRLYSLSILENAIYQVDGLQLDEIKFFIYFRSASIDQLMGQAEGAHYSTFSFYNHEEFVEMLARFKRELRKKFYDLNKITWQDRNIMLKIVKT